jgi:hypothetical protein
MARECCENCMNRDTQLCTYCEVGPYLTRENNFVPTDESLEEAEGEVII